MSAKVTKIIDPEFRTGTKERDDGSAFTWSLAMIEVDDNGKLREATTFDSLKVGDEVTVEKRGKFWNASKPKVGGKGVDLSNLQIAVNDLNAKMDQALNILKELRGDGPEEDISIDEDDIPDLGE